MAKTFRAILVLILTLFVDTAVAGLSYARVTLVRNGELQIVASFSESKLVLNVESLLMSSSVNATPVSATTEDWDRLASDSYVLLDYYQPRKIHLVAPGVQGKRHFQSFKFCCLSQRGLGRALF